MSGATVSAFAVLTPEGSAVVPEPVLGGSSPRRLGRLLQPVSARPSMPANATGRMRRRKIWNEHESKCKLPKIILPNDCRAPIKMSNSALLWLGQLLSAPQAGPRLAPG